MTRRNSNFVIKLLTSIASLATLHGAPAQAETAPPSSSAPATSSSDIAANDQGAGLGDIVVTARKREESQQNVAASIRAFTGQDAQQLGVAKPADLGMVTPGLNAKYASGFENPVFTMRGVGLNDVSAINNPTVGIYVDDVFIPYVPMMSGQIFDVQRIEVLKGPQGSLYGRNTTGGAIKFVSRKPTDRPSANLRADYSSWDTFEFEGGYGGPITDTIKGRVAVLSRQRQSGYLYNRYLGQTVGRQDHLAGRITLDWTPSDKFTAELSIHASRAKDDAALREHIGFIDPVTGVSTCPAVLAGDRGGCVDKAGYADNDGNPFVGDQDNLYGNTITSRAYGGVLSLNYQLPFATLTAISGYDWFNRHLVDDNDASPFIEFELNYFDRIKVFSQEVRLVSNDQSPVKWVAGAFYSWDNTAGSATQAVDVLYKTRVKVTNDQTTKSYAGFLNADVPLTSMLSINGGLRLTREEKTRYTRSEDLASLGNISLISPTHGPYVFTNQTQSIAKTDLSGNIGVTFKPSSDVMLYANAARGFKSGGFKGAISFNPLQLVPYYPETLWAYEAGFKSTLFNGTMHFNAAGYYYNWKNFQAYSLVQLAVPVVVLNNAGDAHIKGVEAELVWRPVSSLRLSAAANYLHGRIVTFNALPGGQNNKGKKLANAPDFTFSGVIRYTAPKIGSSIEPYIQLNANYQSKVFFEIQNNPINSQKAYWLANLRLGATISDHWDLAAYAKNIFDRTYIAESRFIDLKTFPSSNVYGEPRSFGVSLSYNF